MFSTLNVPFSEDTTCAKPAGSWQGSILAWPHCAEATTWKWTWMTTKAIGKVHDESLTSWISSRAFRNEFTYMIQPKNIAVLEQPLIHHWNLKVHTMYWRLHPLFVVVQCGVDPWFLGPTTSDPPADHSSKLVPLTCETWEGTTRVTLIQRGQWVNDM